MTFEEVRVHPRARAYVLASATLGAFTSTVMATSVNVALPTLVTAFDAPFALVQWVVLSYLLATASLLPIAGRLADMFGKRTLFLAGFATFAVGSLLCALAPGVVPLIAFRTVQGAASAVLTALGLAIITDVFPAGERGRAIGVNGAVLSVGIVLGPTLGGFLVEVGWPWVFLFGVPVAAAGFLLGRRFVPRYAPAAPQPFDLAGAATLSSALAALSLALTLGQGRGIADPVILVLFAASALTLAAFTAIERRATAPVVDLRMFLNRRLTVGLVAGVTVFVSIMGTI
ncbi:MAG: MFS transporter, partial [Jiangellaceae bacterium]